LLDKRKIGYENIKQARMSINISNAKEAGKQFQPEQTSSFARKMSSRYHSLVIESGILPTISRPSSRLTNESNFLPRPSLRQLLPLNKDKKITDQTK